MSERSLEPETVSAPRLDVAETIRQKFPDCLHETDHAGRCTVKLSADTPEYCLAEIGQIARRGQQREENKYGQIPLEKHERRELDFSKAPVVHARSCKAIGRGKGVDDWLAYYDPTLPVEAHHDIYNREGGTDVELRGMTRGVMGARR